MSMHPCFLGGRFARKMEERINEQILKERREAQRLARAAAWEAEKAEAQASRVRESLLHKGFHSYMLARWKGVGHQL